ncbi:MAG: DUF429 domain-containing protein [Candidatus Lindowbacteria bacterium]|nr:DUF429 domain-containing protein [Candidatus Lindowbacteria bacterium]
MKDGSVLGIDVGFSERKNTTCFCLMEWSEKTVRWSFEVASADSRERARKIEVLLAEPRQLFAVAIDGPLTRHLRLVSHYRSAEALLSRGVFQKWGKPGQTSSPVGQKLHKHATQLANLVLKAAERGNLSVAPASHIEPIHQTAITEAFPNLFLAVLIDEQHLPVLHRDASDRYWVYLVESNGLDKLMEFLLPGRKLSTGFAEIRDHDKRAAVACALTALAVATELAVGVGDPDDGDIFLPPRDLWGWSRSGESAWAEEALQANVAALHGKSGASHPNHCKARVRLHDRYLVP